MLGNKSTHSSTYEQQLGRRKAGSVDRSTPHGQSPGRVSRDIEALLKINGAFRQRLAQVKATHHRESLFAATHERLVETLEQVTEEMRADVLQKALTIQPLSSAATGDAGCMTPVDYYIQRMGYTTSSCEELPHVIAKYKPLEPWSHLEVNELKQQRKSYEDELAYYEEVHQGELHFTEAITQLIGYMKLYFARFREILEERNRARHGAACEWLAKFGIDSTVEDFEHLVF